MGPRPNIEQEGFSGRCNFSINLSQKPEGVSFFPFIYFGDHATDQTSTDVKVPRASDRLSFSISARSAHVNKPPWPVLSLALEAEAGMIYNMDAPTSC